MPIDSTPNFDILALSADDPLSSSFSKYTDVFGVRTYATQGVANSKLIHASKILAEYLDNDENGIADNRQVVQSIINNNASMAMFRNESEQNTFDFDQMLDGGMRIQNLFDDETHINGSANGLFDASLEEVLHLITDYGYAQVFPSALSVTETSELTTAMDIARGGTFTVIPEQYPSGAWYTYYDETSDYSTQATEYFYWGLTSYLGGQQFAGRKESIQDEWTLNTKELIQSTDTLLFNIISSEELGLPAILPNGVYNVNQVEGDETSNSSVYRLFNSSTSKHLFSSNQSEIDSLTGQANAGWVNEGLAYISPSTGSANVHRFYIKGENRHFYTASESEKDNIINNEKLSHFAYEGVAYKAYESKDAPENAVQVIRYYNSSLNTHLYSTSSNEQNILDQDLLWNNEGIAWYSDNL